MKKKRKQLNGKYSDDRDSAEVVKIRYNPECAYLYHLYHYNEWVKDAGANVIEVRFHYNMCDA